MCIPTELEQSSVVIRFGSFAFFLAKKYINSFLKVE